MAIAEQHACYVYLQDNMLRYLIQRSLLNRVWSFGSRVHLLLISGPHKQPRGCVPKSITNDIRVCGNMRIASFVWTNSVWRARRLNERFWIGPSVASWHNCLLVACLMDRWSKTLQTNGLSCRKLQDCRPDWERFGSCRPIMGKLHDYHLLVLHVLVLDVMCSRWISLWFREVVYLDNLGHPVRGMTLFCGIVPWVSPTSCDGLSLLW
jgi:hypothetical protein